MLAGSDEALVYPHDPEVHPDTGFAAPGGAVETLVRLRDDSVIGHLGVAGGDTPTMERRLDLDKTRSRIVRSPPPHIRRSCLVGLS